MICEETRFGTDGNLIHFRVCITRQFKVIIIIIYTIFYMLLLLFVCLFV
jgi:hypothetical protein